MSLTTLVIPKRNQVNLSFTGPLAGPPDGSPQFSTWSGWGSTLGNGYSRLVSAGLMDITKRSGVWEPYYYFDIVNPDNTFYGGYHVYTTTGHISDYIVNGTGAFLTDDGLNVKLLGNAVGGTSLGVISVDLDGSTVIDGGDTISITFNDDGFIQSHSGVTQRFGIEKFSMGFGVSWVAPTSGGIPAADGYYAITDFTDTKYNAFQNDADYELTRRWSHNTTDGTYNYTLMSARPKSLLGGVPYVQLYKWVPEAFGTTYSQTNHALQLDDPTDDALFQDFVVFTPGKSAAYGPGIEDYAVSIMTNNQNTQISGGVLADPTLVQQTMFVFAPDYSWYDRVDTVADGKLTSGFVFLDLLGNYHLGGDNDDGAFYYFGGDSSKLRAWRFPQDNHEFYVAQLGTLTLVYDKLSGMWSQWKSPDFDYFRGADGCEWKGINVCCDTESGKIWQIDPEGRLDYGTTPIVSKVFSGLTERFRIFVPCYMAELAVTEGQPPEGIDASTVGITLRSGDGLTWYNHGTVDGSAIGEDLTVRWYGIGLMKSPGKVFEITDTGYARCISGFTIETGRVNA